MMTDQLQAYSIQWLDYLAKICRLSQHTISAYQTDLRMFCRFFAKHKGETVSLEILEQATVTEYRAWLAERQQQGVSHRSLARAVSALKSLLRFLIERQYIRSSCIDLLKLPKLGKTLPKPISADEALQLLDEIVSVSDESWIGLRDRALFTLLYSCGLRISEALGLRYGDVVGQRQLQIMGKGRKQRVVPILPVVRQTIADYVAACPHSISPASLLFLGSRGGVLNPGVAQKHLRQYRHLAGLPETATPHALRHSCATHLMAGSHNIRAVQELLGHESLSTTQIYTELQTEQLFEVYEKAHPRSKK